LCLNNSNNSGTSQLSTGELAFVSGYRNAKEDEQLVLCERNCMYAEVNDWSVTLYADEKGKDLGNLQTLVCYLQARGVSFGQSGVIPLPPPIKEETEEEKKMKAVRPEPYRYVWFPYQDESSLKEILGQAGFCSSSVRFDRVELAWNAL